MYSDSVERIAVSVIYKDRWEAWHARADYIASASSTGHVWIPRRTAQLHQRRILGRHLPYATRTCRISYFKSHPSPTCRKAHHADIMPKPSPTISSACPIRISVRRMENNRTARPQRLCSRLCSKLCRSSARSSTEALLAALSKLCSKLYRTVCA